MYLPVKQIGNPDSSISQPLFFWCTLIVNYIYNKCDGKTSGGCHRIGEEFIVGVYRSYGDVAYGR